MARVSLVSCINLFAANQLNTFPVQFGAHQLIILIIWCAKSLMCFWCLHIGFSHLRNQFRAAITSIINISQSYGEQNRYCARKTTHHRRGSRGGRRGARPLLFASIFFKSPLNWPKTSWERASEATAPPPFSIPGSAHAPKTHFYVIWKQS